MFNSIKLNPMFQTIIRILIVLVIIYASHRLNTFNKNTKKIASIKKNFNIKNVIVSFILLILSIFLIGIATIKSYTTEWKHPNSANSNTNIVFVLDVSKSMNTIDVRLNWHITTRLKLAKKAILNYISQHPDYKYSLVIFAWQAQAILPLTNDISIFSTFLEGVDYRNLTKQGTNFSEAIRLALERLKTAKWKKYLVVISDWWDPWDYKWLNFSFPKQIKSFVFGVGSQQGWKIFLWTDDFDEPIFERYQGQYVITKLNKENLQKLASDINWKYFDLDSPDSLNILNNYIKSSFTKTKNKPTQNENYTLILTILSLLLLLGSVTSKYLLSVKNNQWK